MYYRSKIFLIFCLVSGCGPKIFYFNARPCTTITKAGSIKFNWKLRGVPTLLQYQEGADDPETPGKYFQYYKLVARKGKKEAAYPVLGITVLSDTSTDYIMINTVRLGDSAVAIANRDTLEWGKRFILDQVFSGSNRPMTVSHLGRKAELDAQGNASLAFRECVTAANGNSGRRLRWRRKKILR